MGGVIALTFTACTSDSVFNDIDQPASSLQADGNNSGGMTTFSENGQTKRYKVDVKTYLGGTTDLVSTLRLSIVP